MDRAKFVEALKQLTTMPDTLDEWLRESDWMISQLSAATEAMRELQREVPAEIARQKAQAL